MTNAPEIAVLGFRPHTYWTAAVALAGVASAPRVLRRERIVFAVGDERNVYHHACDLGPEAGRAWVVRVGSATESKAAGGIAEMISALDAAGLATNRAVVPTGRPGVPEHIEDIARSHTLKHAAEGVFYRDVVARACARQGLEVRRIPERELRERACGRLGVSPPMLEARLKAMGAMLGPPWSEDERLAALAAWIGIADLSA